jgi:hypothetical protein
MGMRLGSVTELSVTDRLGRAAAGGDVRIIHMGTQNTTEVPNQAYSGMVLTNTESAGADLVRRTAKETGKRTRLRNLLRTLSLAQFRIRDHPSPSRCSARKL